MSGAMHATVSIVRRSALLALVLAAGSPAAAQDVRLPNKSGSLKFAIIGDTGTAAREQNEVGHQMWGYHAKFPFELVIMLGDNIYGADSAADYKSKFEGPYQEMLNGGVKFYACLGNHDNPTQRTYKSFNMGGERFYTFKPQQGVRFFALDSNYMDKPELDWLEKELAKSGSEWKIAYFHHPMYSSGARHGSS
ncbi:MAG TPA: metallophosphoesterase, partial [Vicinamibacteria bacterium]|nr:metallophosphoesterase [Vicinamibacteria bacterium]